MCQLSLIDLGNKQANSVFALTLMQINSKTLNKDGCGIFNPGRGVLKSAKPANTLEDLGDAFADHDGKGMNDAPILAHVRAASLSLENKLLTAEHAHPFRSVHYVLAHNGTLNFKNKEKDLEYKDKEVIDSEIFLAELEKGYTGNVYEDLVTTMDLFRGKFAFIIYHIPESKFYVVRGKTANLHYLEAEVDGVPGIVINTEKFSLEDALMAARNVLYIFGHVVKCTSNIPKLIDEEFVFVLEEHKLKLLGKITESPREVAASTTNFHQDTFTRGGTTTTNGVVSIAATSTSVEVSEAIVKVSNMNMLSLIDLDKLFVILMGRCLLEFGEEHPKVLFNWLEELAKRNNPKYKKIWKKMITHSTPEILYKLYPDLQFPYFLTEMGRFRDIFKQERDRLSVNNILVTGEDE